MNDQKPSQPAILESAVARAENVLNNSKAGNGPSLLEALISAYARIALLEQATKESQPENTKLTVRQAAIIGAYTGVLCGDWVDMVEYIKSKIPRLSNLDRVDILHILAYMPEKELEEATKSDFLSISNEGQS